MNGLEYEKIKIEQLPKSWQSETALRNFQNFLQSSWQERKIFYSDGQGTTNQQFINFEQKDCIKLQNYIGSIVFQGEQLNIFPKLFQNKNTSARKLPDPNKREYDYVEEREQNAAMLTRNISFWLQYCDRLNVPFFSIRDTLSGEQNMWELFISLYANYTKQLIEREPYFQYENKRETGEIIRGRINEKEYLQKYYSTGLWHQVPYEYSEFTLDNCLNQVMKYTCQLLENNTKEVNTRQKLKEIIWKLREVTSKKCTPDDCSKILLNIRHKAYQIVLDMSQMFLRSFGNAMETGQKESYCFLFPTELLFESFTSGFLRHCLPNSMTMRTQTNDQYLANLLIDGKDMGTAFGLREDILIQTEEEIIILDTKYKELPPFDDSNLYSNRRFGISDQDVRQIAIYAAKRNAEHVFLVYPLLWKEKLTEKEIGYQIWIQEEKPVYLEILKIPFLIEESQEKTEEELRKKMEKIVSGKRFNLIK